MRPKNGFAAIALTLVVASGTLACQEEQGALEKAGEKVDETIDDITHPGEGPVEEAGRKLGEKVDELEEDIENQ